MARGEVYVPLSVDYADDPKIIAAGERAEVLYVRALCLSKRILSDGFVADVQLSRFGLSGVHARARRLVEVGLWARVDNGYQVVAFLKRNRSRADVLADRAAEADRKRRERSRVRPDTDPPSDRTPGGRPTGVPRPETKTETVTSDSSSSDSRPAEPELDGRPNRKLETALSILADRDLTARQRRADREPLHDVEAWTRKAIQGRRARHGAELVRLAVDHPRLTPTELADRLDERLDHQHDDAQAAARARAEAGMTQVRELTETDPDPDLNATGTEAARRALRSVPTPEAEGDT